MAPHFIISSVYVVVPDDIFPKILMEGTTKLK